MAISESMRFKAGEAGGRNFQTNGQDNDQTPERASSPSDSPSPFCPRVAFLVANIVAQEASKTRFAGGFTVAIAASQMDPD